MKVAIIVPRSYNKKQLYKEYPLGAGYVGTALLENGHDVRIYDQNIELFDNDELVKEVLSFNPKAIGFSILTATYPTAIEIIEVIKKQNSKVTIFAGGIHPSLFPVECVESDIDYVIKGEGEIADVKLIDYLEGKLSIDEVPNITFKCNGEIIDKPKEIIDMDIDSIPIINRDLFKIDKYTTHSISGSRGCPFSCKFCCSYNHLSSLLAKDRVRCVESIIEEIKYVVSKYSKKEFFFTDDVFFTNILNLRKFNYLLAKENIDIIYNAQLRVNMLTDEVCKLLKESGCKKIEIGAESGSDAILQNSCKGIRTKDISKGIAIAKKNNLRIKTNWIYGLPGNMNEQYKSIDLMIKTMPNEISIHQLIPFPGTEYYENRDKYGIIIKDPKDFKSFCYGDLDDNISYEYMNKEQYMNLIDKTILKLEAAGYVSSDISDSNSKYVYTTPFDKKSLKTISA